MIHLEEKIYEDVGPFLYKDDSSVTDVILDKFISLKDKKYSNPFHLPESDEIKGRLKFENIYDEFDY